MNRLLLIPILVLVLIFFWMWDLITSEVNACDSIIEYRYKGKSYDIFLPADIYEKQECFTNWECETTDYERKLIFLNGILIRKGLPELF